jgi:hypothetical protein
MAPLSSVTPKTVDAHAGVPHTEAKLILAPETGLTAVKTAPLILATAKPAGLKREASPAPAKSPASTLPLFARVIASPAAIAAPAAAHAATPLAARQTVAQLPAAKPAVAPLSAHPPLPPVAHHQRQAKPMEPVAAKKHEVSPSDHVLPPEVKSAIENSYSISLDGVEFHADSHAQAAAATFSARAFAYGKHIFLGRNEKLKDLQLIAHEAAHVVQQQSVPTVLRWAPGQSDAFETEADQAAAAAMRGEKFSITGRVAKPRVQRWSPLKWVREHVSDLAYNIPGYRLLTVLIGRDPITSEDVDRSAANILRGIIELVPLVGHQIEKALDQYGVFDKIGGWIEEQIQKMFAVGHAIKKDWDDFVDDLGWTDIRHPIQVVEDALGVFKRAIERIAAFIADVVSGILEMLKKAILVPLAKLVRDQTSAWPLLTAVLGKDPITGEKVDGSPEAVIGGFMTLIHQEDVWNNIKKANAISRAWTWFKDALKELLGFVSQIPSLFIQALKSLTIEDILLLPKGVAKVIGLFVSFGKKFFIWAGEKVWNLLQIIFEVVAPGAMPYLKKVGAAFKSILKNPIAFVGHLVDAGKLGFQLFKDHFGDHLRKSFFEWLTKSLKGVYIPKSFELREIVKFVLSVLGLTWENIRTKLVKVLGETAVKSMETGFDIVVTLVKEGPAAAWDKIVEQLSNLQDMVVKAIMDFVVVTVVKRAVAQIASLLVPGAAFIQAIIAIYSAIKVFIEKLAKIIEVAKAFLDSLIEIVSGQIAGAAKKVETTMAGMLTLAISFLAGFLHIDSVADKVLEIIEKIRAPIDKALDKVIDWIVTMAKRAGKFVVGAVTGEGRKPAAAAPPIAAALDDPTGVKALVRADLRNRSISNAEQANEILSGEFQKFVARGLKGLRVAYDAKDPSHLIVLANASVTEEVARLPVTATGARQALDYFYRFTYLNYRTVLYVYYDGGKQFGDVVMNEPGEFAGPHAEDVFERDHVANLAQRIAEERKAGTLRTPSGQRVPVELDLNRLPCSHCSSLIPRLARQYPELAFTVKAATISNADVVQRSVPIDSSVHIDFIENMIRQNVNVEPLLIFEAIWSKLLEVALAAKTGKVKLRSEALAIEVASARQLLDQNLTETARVKALIAAAKERAALAKIPPKGSAP